MPEPTTLLAIGAGAAALSGAVGAVGAISSGKAQANAAEYQAEVTQQQADQERIASRQDEEDFRRDQSRLLAQRRAAMGGSGVDMATGSPLLANEDFASEVELQARRIRAGGETRATRLGQQAGLYESQAGSAKTAGFKRGGSLLLQGDRKSTRLNSSH